MIIQCYESSRTNAIETTCCSLTINAVRTGQILFTKSHFFFLFFLLFLFVRVFSFLFLSNEVPHKQYTRGRGARRVSLKRERERE